MIRTSTYATPKYALNDTYLISPVTNIAGQQVIPITSGALTISSGSIPTKTNHAIVALNGSPHVRLTVWVEATVTGQAIRIIGYSKTKDNKYVPSLLYYGVLAALAADGQTILGDTLYPVVTFAEPTKGPAVTANDSNQMYHNSTGYAPIPGSLFLNTMGYTYLDFEFVAASANTWKSNVYLTEV